MNTTTIAPQFSGWSIGFAAAGFAALADPIAAAAQTVGVKPATFPTSPSRK